jgi:prepilin-type N-terminal cleavage/methylation domain-containing protein
MCSALTPWGPTTNRRAFTLLEVAVTLLLLALAAALALPVLRFDPAATALQSTTGGNQTLLGVIAEARALAVRRAESLRLRVDTLGAWQLATSSAWTAPPLRSGQLRVAPQSALAVELSPIGACFARDPGRLLANWDTVRCAPATAEARP